MNKSSRVRPYIPKPSRREYFTIIILVIEIIIFSIVSKNFLSANNLETVLRNSTDLAVVSIGMTMVMVLGGIDISVGSALGVVAIFVGWMLQREFNPILIGFVAVLLGTMIGVFNGFLVTKAKIPAIIATLGISNILRAAIFGMLGGSWLTGLPQVFTPFTKGHIFGIAGPCFSPGYFLLYFLGIPYVYTGRAAYLCSWKQRRSINIIRNFCRPHTNSGLWFTGIIGWLFGIDLCGQIGQCGNYCWK